MLLICSLFYIKPIEFPWHKALANSVPANVLLVRIHLSFKLLPCFSPSCSEWARGESTIKAIEFDQPGQEDDVPSEEAGEVIADIGRQSPSAEGALLKAEERGRCDGVSL